MAVEALSIASDQEIIWQGNKKDFDLLGFTESQLGGFVLSQGKLSFDRVKKEESDYKKRPKATGSNLLNFVIDTMKNQIKEFNWTALDKSAKVDELKKIFSNWKYTNGTTGNLWDYLQLEEEITKEGFAQLMTELNSSKAQQGNKDRQASIAQVVDIINQWVNTVRF